MPYFYSKSAFVIISEPSLAVSVLHFFLLKAKVVKEPKEKPKKGKTSTEKEQAHRRHCARKKWFFVVSLTQAQEKQAKEPKPDTKVHMGR